MQSLEHITPPNFKSKGEINCAKVFEKFIGDWKAVEGKTYEHPIGFSRAVDFKIGGLLVEYHPIDLRREVLNKQLLGAIRAGLRNSPARVRKKVMMALVEEYQEQYAKRRKQLVSSSEHVTVRSCELICCFDKIDVFEKVVLRLNPRVTRVEFLKEWNS